MKKERHNPEKEQNNYGGDYDCKQYDKRNDGGEWCHDEGNSNWIFVLQGSKTSLRLPLRWLYANPAIQFQDAFQPTGFLYADLNLTISWEHHASPWRDF